MKTILVPIEESDVLPSMLRIALLVANRFGSYIEGLHERPALTEFVAAGDGLGVTPPDLVKRFEEQDMERTHRAKALFEAFMNEHGVRRSAIDEPSDTPTYGWLEEVSPGHDVIGSHGRLFDLIVVGRPVKGASTPSMSMLEAALFDSGRPILIAPPTPPETVGDHCVIAWNGSSEAARTIAFAMPLLAKAKKVTVLTVEDGMVPGSSTTEVAQHLIRNDIPADHVDAKAGYRTVGEAILEETMALGADLLVKGAYTQSRVRQMIFGGATSHILAKAELPVLMAH